MARLNLRPAAPKGSLFVKTSSSTITDVAIRTPEFTEPLLYQLTVIRGLRENQRITGYYTDAGKVINQAGSLEYLGTTSNGDQVYRSASRLRSSASSGATKYIDIGDRSG